MGVPSLTHCCPRCAATTQVPASAAVFSELQHCTHCGTSSHGIFISAQQTAVHGTMMQAFHQQQQQQQDDLSRLFAQTMTLSSITPPPDARLQPAPPALSPFQSPTPAKAAADQAIVYTSSHYTPTRHMVPVRFTPTPEVTPERQLPLSDDDMIRMLEQNSIDPRSLYESQVHLLRHADSEQRLRLLELWRISPPNVGTSTLIQRQSLTSTSLEQEEQLAKLRYEHMIAEQAASIGRTGSSMSDELTVGAPPVSVMMDRPASAPGIRSSAEPYMTSGYEQLAQRDYERSGPLQESTNYNQATDPAYAQHIYMKAGKENLVYATAFNNDDMEL